MPFAERMKYNAFVENRQNIEAKWSREFGDRQNELVFIGQDLNKEQMLKELETCLCNSLEIKAMQQGLFPTQDEWPVPAI